MELRSLYYFLAVAREGTITRAADFLHMTQPTLSRILIQLEEDVGTPLMVRGKRKIQLTEAGMILRRRAEEILELVNKTEQELGSNDRDLEGQLNIGAAECLAANLFLPKAMKAFSERHPLVTYDLYTGNADLIKDRIDQGILDLGLLLEPVDMIKYDFVRLPQREEWGLVVNREDALASRPHITPEDLCGIPLINTKRSIIQNEIASWAKDTYDRLRFVATYNLLSNAISMVENGIGSVITISGSCYHRSMKKVIFVPFFPALTTDSVLVWKKNQVLSQTTTKFIEHIYSVLETSND